MKKELLLGQALTQPNNHIAYFVAEQLAQSHPEKYVLETTRLGVDAYANAGHCTLTYDPAVFNQISTFYNGRDVMRWGPNAWFKIEWQGQSLGLLQMQYKTGGYCDDNSCWIIAETREIAEAFLQAVSAWGREVRQEIMVFENGYWDKSEELYRSIQSASFDNLILPATLKTELRADLHRFFAARETYEEIGAPWKRGLLLMGPPGNGKTHAVKAIVNQLGLTCLYVKTFVNRHGDENAIKGVFDMARQMAPCVLVLEDLDSMITEQTRSFFLNEMDGFAQNQGIAVVATTNYPEKLDPAILSRPSRFDRKYYFQLPSEAERLAYFELWNQTAKPQVKLSPAALEKSAQLTEGFSFAYLKELLLASLLHWINERRDKAMDAVLETQITVLREQLEGLPLPLPDREKSAAS